MRCFTFSDNAEACNSRMTSYPEVILNLALWLASSGQRRPLELRWRPSLGHVVYVSELFFRQSL
jgi:hypothetical protein